MVERTARHALSLLQPGQGQKDVTHNEAVVSIDLLLQCAVVSRSVSVPPAMPVAGTCWLLPEGCEGAWQGRDGALACWTEGGWRYLGMPEGGQLWVKDEGRRLRHSDGGWVLDLPFGEPLEALPVPGGGDVVDQQARDAIGSLVARLVGAGLLSA